MTQFRILRKAHRLLDEKDAYQYLTEAPFGVLSTLSVDNGYPYATAVNHVVIDGDIYFHSALDGHKIDNIETNNLVSFFVILDATVNQTAYTTNFKSVHVFGKASVVTDKKERFNILMKIAKKFTGEAFRDASKHINEGLDQTKVIKIEIDHISGKYRDK